ncbi:VOC family protein [Nocardioides caldifontis]|uniref:VOC family protein n=1 Tax=Nocardioides caldifontis TaxID=2588938 RepID=UPI0011E02E05|nr:VOC family protein [Nocardioides caldifontis]
MTETTTETTTQPATELRAPANGEHTVDGTPRSATSLTPFLVVEPAEAAITFYTEVFGARLVDRTDMPGPDGRTIVAHAVLDLGQGQLQLGDPNPAFHLVPKPEGEDDCYSMGLYRPDVDAVVARAVEHGATVREPVTNFVSGDRYASIRDPFGVRWSVMTRVEDLSDEESAARVAEWAKSLG